MYTVSLNVTFESREQADLALATIERETDSIVTNAMDDSDDAQGEAMDRVTGALYQSLQSPRRYRVRLERKPSDLRADAVTVQREVELDEGDWGHFEACPLDDYGWIDGNPVLVHGPDGQSVLVDPQGSTYARYAARLS